MSSLERVQDLEAQISGLEAELTRLRPELALAQANLYGSLVADGCPHEEAIRLAYRLEST